MFESEGHWSFGSGSSRGVIQPIACCVRRQEVAIVWAKESWIAKGLPPSIGKLHKLMIPIPEAKIPNDHSPNQIQPGSRNRRTG